MKLKVNKYTIAALIVFLAIAISLGLNVFKPRARKAKPSPTVPVVTTVRLSPSTETVHIEAYGEIVPAKRIEVFAQVEGKVIGVHPDLVPGGTIKKGERIIQIDPKDYELEVRARKALVSEARLALRMERAQQRIAQREWEVTGTETSKGNQDRSLALREPQIESVLANLDAAESALAAARLAKARTTITSPFNALVLEKSIDLGHLVNRQRSVATLAGTDEFWVQVSVPANRLKWIRFPGAREKTGSPAEVFMDTDKGQRLVRKAMVYKLIGELDPKGKMARVLLRLPDPLRLSNSLRQKNSTDPSGRPARKGDIALLGSFVKVSIEAGSLDGVYPVPRKALRDNNRVWVLSRKSTLEIRDVEIAWHRKDDLLVSSGLNPGDRLITSRIQSPLPGMKLMAEGMKNKAARTAVAPGAQSP